MVSLRSRRGHDRGVTNRGRYDSGMVVLVRYGAIPEVARFSCTVDCTRGDRVVVETHRGRLLGDVLSTVAPSVEPDTDEPDPSGQVIRQAEPDDRIDEHAAGTAAASSFADWTSRIAEWNIEVELLEVEHSLDRTKTTLYVLCGRDAETTKLALQAAAAGLGIIDVQPVTADGVVPPAPSGGGCGSCGH